MPKRLAQIPVTFFATPDMGITKGKNNFTTWEAISQPSCPNAFSVLHRASLRDWWHVTDSSSTRQPQAPQVPESGILLHDGLGS